MILTRQEISWFNKNFRITYQEKDVTPRRRHLVGAGRLHLYIGEDNARKCFEVARNSAKQAERFQFRKQGLIIFYSK